MNRVPARGNPEYYRPNPQANYVGDGPLATFGSFFRAVIIPTILIGGGAVLQKKTKFMKKLTRKI